MIKTLISAALLMAGAAQAAVVTVNATDAIGGAGADGGFLNAGQSFTVIAADTDLWSAGALPRWSNANGLTGNLYATGTDESGAGAGTLIGQDFGMYTIGSQSFAYGELVGQIGNGAYFAIGTDYTAVAATAGELHLYYWDSAYGDNSGSINVSVVPEPGSVALLLAGIGMIGGLARRRAQKSA